MTEELNKARRLHPPTSFGKLGLFPWDRGDWAYFESSRNKNYCFYSWVDPLRVVERTFPDLWDEWMLDRRAMARGLKDGDGLLREIFTEVHEVFPENLDYLMRWLSLQGWRRPAYIPEIVSSFMGQGAWRLDAPSLLIWFDALGTEYQISPTGFNHVTALGIRALTSAFTGDVRTHWASTRAGKVEDRAFTGANTFQLMSWWTGVDPAYVSRYFEVAPDNFWRSLWHQRPGVSTQVKVSPRPGKWEYRPMTNWSSFSHLKGEHARKIAEDFVLLGMVKLWLIDSATEDPEIRADLQTNMKTTSRADLWASALGLGVPERLPLMRLLGPPFVNACEESAFRVGFPRIRK